LRVLQVHNRYRSSSPGGEDRVVDQEGAALAERGHVVERFERSNDDIDHWSLPRRAMVPGQVVWSNSARRELKAAIERFGPDVVHVHNTFPLLSASVLYACRDAKAPVVVTLHNYRLACATGDLFRDGKVCHACVGHLPIPAVRHGCYRSPLATAPVALASALHARAWRTLPSAYVCISASQRAILEPLDLPRERVFVKANLVPRSIVPRSIAPPAAVATNGGAGVPQPFVVYAGRLAPAKGIRLLMRAWDAHTAAREPGLQLVIAGSGPLDAEVEAWAAGRSSVDVRGLLSRDDCAALVAGARAAIVPSEWEEAFGLVAIEAMALGVPPVAPALGSFLELVRDGHDGVLFTPHDPDALAAVLREIETDPERFADLGRNARAGYEQRFDPDANIAQLVATYEFAIANPSSRSRAFSRRQG
jgi:glycosyltransferase involved in cell wall biosynthesis